MFQEIQMTNDYLIKHLSLELIATARSDMLEGVENLLTRRVLLVAKLKHFLMNLSLSKMQCNLVCGECKNCKLVVRKLKQRMMLRMSSL